MEKNDWQKTNQGWHENLTDLIERKKAENEMLRKIKETVLPTAGSLPTSADANDGLPNDHPPLKKKY